MSKRKEFNTATKAAAMKRCMKPDGLPKCEKCGVMLKGGRFAFDHVNPDGLTGEPTLENCMVLCSQFAGSCHDVKTRKDTHWIAKAKRREAKHLGIKTNSRPFPCGKSSNWKQKIGGQVVPREQR